MHGVECHEGKYMAQSSAPLLLAKLPVGFMSGKLLQRYCPKHLGEGEVRHSKIIALSTIISPVLITLLWGYISGGGTASSGGGNSNDDGEGLIIDGSDKYTIEGGTSMEDGDPTGESSSEYSYQRRKPLTSSISLPRVRREERPLV